jgi:hypothetical protein
MPHLSDPCEYEDVTLIEVARVLGNTLSVTEKTCAKYQPGYRRAARFEGAEERV